MNPITYRRAFVDDAEFIAMAILAADRSGTPNSSYCALFQMEEKAFLEMVIALLEMELEDCEFSVAAFCIAESDGIRAGACAGWMEGAQGIPSWQMKFTALRYVLSPEALIAFQNMQTRVKGMMPERTNGALQIESVYITPAFRGNGIVEGMIQHHMEWNQLASKQESLTEIITYDNNARAIRAYEKLGFRITSSTKLTDPEVILVYPADGMVLMQK